MGNMKKYKLIIAFSLLFPLGNTFANDELKSLATEMAIVFDGSTKESRRYARRQYESIDSKFSALNIEDKNTVVNMGKKISSGGEENLSADEMLVNSSIELAAKLAEDDGVFFGDLSDEEMMSYFKRAENTLLDDSQHSQRSARRTYSNRSRPCYNRSFPNWISKNNPGSNRTYLPYYYSKVKNGDEYLCDWELWYNKSKNNVWGKSWFSRKMLDDFGGGLSKRTFSNMDRLIVGRLRGIFWVGTGSLIARRVVIW